MKAKTLLEDLFGSRIGALKIPEQGSGVAQAIELCKHIIAMGDDDYLVGHPEWEEIVKEAEIVLAILKGE